jgi:hypothetical protein
MYITMPCLPLVITSACFFIPSVIGFLRRRTKDATAIALLSCTSLWFHSTHVFHAYVIDKAYAHILGLSYSIRCVWRCVRLHRVCDFAILALTAGTVACYILEGDTLKVLLHIGVHGCSITAFSLYMVTSTNETAHKNITNE